ncbi:hypothetical protein N9359_04255 [Luminiphilus sp.]|nr:hypothetical protein [Luminiphilus sp.]
MATSPSLAALLLILSLSTALLGCSSPRESTTGLPAYAASDADWPAPIVNTALRMDLEPLPLEVGVVVLKRV